MKNTNKTIFVIALGIITSCNTVKETKTADIKENVITLKDINLSINANEISVVDLKFDAITASFRVEFLKSGNNSDGVFTVNMTNNLVNNDQAPIVFSGNAEFVKKYEINDLIDDKQFVKVGTIFLRGKSSPNYNITIVGSPPLDISNYAVFKVTNKVNNKEIYGWLNFIATTDKISFQKMGYSSKPLSYVGQE
jgi:hypothetical protein